jgi:catechol 2,3-dioxygenase-like lactoylglutathione lyase family enzyme
MQGVQGRPVMAILGTADMDRALGFYSATLGLSVISSDAFGTSLEGGGTELRLTRVPTVVPSPYAQLAWRVTDLDSVLESLVALGVDLVRFDHLEQDEAGAWTSPTGVRVAWFRDPDRNLLSLVEDPSR